MKNKTKKALAFGAIAIGAVMLSSCTQSFCSTTDQSQILYAYEQGITVYCSQSEIPTAYQTTATLAIEGNANVWKYVPVSIDVETEKKTYTAYKASYLQTLIDSAITNGYRVPSQEYFEKIDEFTLHAAIVRAAGISYTGEADFQQLVNNNPTFVASITVNDVSQNQWCVNPYVEADPGETVTPIEVNHADDGVGNSILRLYGDVKFSGRADEDYPLWGNLTAWNTALKADANFGLEKCPGDDWFSSYKSALTAKISSLRSCIATQSATFGHYGYNSDWEVDLSVKDWGYAWSKGFLEGLLVYPVSWLVDTFAFGMDASLSGWSQLLAIVFVTLIVRGIMLAATFKNTLSQQKMTALQPQLAKIQAKYPNSNTNQAEKQRMAQEQMMLYKRNKINPLSSIIVLVFQFPIFICVWSALQGSAALSSGSFLGVRLSDTIKDAIFNMSGAWYTNVNGWWTAVVLFLLMASAQIVSMLLPQWMQRKATSNISKTTANPAQNQSNKTMKIVMWVMVIMTIVMGFFLPAAMGVYWFIGALVSMLQTFITQSIIRKKSRK